MYYSGKLRLLVCRYIVHDFFLAILFLFVCVIYYYHIAEVNYRSMPETHMSRHCKSTESTKLVSRIINDYIVQGVLYRIFFKAHIYFVDFNCKSRRDSMSYIKNCEETGC